MTEREPSSSPLPKSTEQIICFWRFFFSKYKLSREEMNLLQFSEFITIKRRLQGLMTVRKLDYIQGKSWPKVKQSRDQINTLFWLGRENAGQGSRRIQGDSWGKSCNGVAFESFTSRGMDKLGRSGGLDVEVQVWDLGRRCRVNAQLWNLDFMGSCRLCRLNSSKLRQPLSVIESEHSWLWRRLNWSMEG